MVEGLLVLVLHPLEIPATCEQTSLHSVGRLSTLMFRSATATAARPERIESLVKSMLAFLGFDRKRLYCVVASDVEVKSRCEFAVMMDKMTGQLHPSLYLPLFASYPHPNF